jgi:hypothetical protein
MSWPDEAVKLGELLDEIRQYYLERLRAQIAKERAGAAQVISEPSLRNAAGDVVREGPLSLPLRVDITVVDRGGSSRTLRVETPQQLSFEPVELQWSSRLSVTLAPFSWNACPVALCVEQNTETNLAPLIDWFERWFDADDTFEADELGISSVVHFMSDPSVDDNEVSFQVDFGSAPVSAFEELLDAAEQLGTESATIGRVSSTHTALQHGAGQQEDGT